MKILKKVFPKKNEVEGYHHSQNAHLPFIKKYQKKWNYNCKLCVLQKMRWRGTIMAKMRTYFAPENTKKKRSSSVKRVLQANKSMLAKMRWRGTIIAKSAHLLRLRKYQINVVIWCDPKNEVEGYHHSQNAHLPFTKSTKTIEPLYQNWRQMCVS